ncbi:hypothetical protein IWW36_002803, partial [Coemansia brasiliensis]
MTLDQGEVPLSQGIQEWISEREAENEKISDLYTVEDGYIKADGTFEKYAGKRIYFLCEH